MATTWAVGTAYAAGRTVVPVTLATYYYECTTAGTSHGATEPTWPTTPGETVNDNGVIWKCMANNANSHTGQVRLTLGASGVSITLTHRNLKVVETIGHPDADWVGTNADDPNASDYKSSSDVYQISGFLIGPNAMAEGHVLAHDIFKPRKKHSRGGGASRYILLTLTGDFATLHGSSSNVRGQGSDCCKIQCVPGVETVQVNILVKEVKT